ncbi:MAG TPA: VOC family protein [Polyangia bacterium]|nr:VOC family protein [Polyangia bacterium]
MFKDSPTFNSVSVDDLQKARRFYAQTLGLKVAEQPEGLSVSLAGGGRLFIYPKPNHQPATFTILNFEVPDVAAAVAELGRQGVQVEHYDGPGLKTDAQGILRGDRGPRAIAWFKDPAGNILSVVEPR